MHKDCHSPAEVPKNFTYKTFGKNDINKGNITEIYINYGSFSCSFSFNIFCSLSRLATIR